MEKLNKNEFVSLMNYCGKPMLSVTEKNILSYLIRCDRPFTIGYICQKLDYTTQEIRDCFKKVYKAFKVYESEDGDKTNNRFIFDESIVGRNTNSIDDADEMLELEKRLDYCKDVIENTDMSESTKNSIKVLVNIYELLQHKRHFVYALMKLSDHSRVWAGEKIPQKYKYNMLLALANDTMEKYEFSEPQKVIIDKCIKAIRLNDRAS